MPRLLRDGSIVGSAVVPETNVRRVGCGIGCRLRMPPHFLKTKRGPKRVPWWGRTVFCTYIQGRKLWANQHRTIRLLRSSPLLRYHSRTRPLSETHHFCYINLCICPIMKRDQSVLCLFGTLKVGEHKVLSHLMGPDKKKDVESKPCIGCSENTSKTGHCGSIRSRKQYEAAAELDDPQPLWFVFHLSRQTNSSGE